MAQDLHQSPSTVWGTVLEVFKVLFILDRAKTRAKKVHLTWSLLVALLSLGLSIGLGFVWKLPDVNAIVPSDAPDNIPKACILTEADKLPNPTTLQLSIVVDFLSIDSTAGTLVADWYLFHSDCNKPEIVANIFFDPSVVRFPFE